MPLRLLRRVVLASALTVTFVLCLSSVARAQVIAIYQEQSLPRVDSEGNTLAKRPITLMPEGVNYQDCLDDQRIRFPLQISPAPEGNALLQVWAGNAGTDCKDQTNRTSANANCWLLVTGVPLTVNPIVDIPVRSIMAGAPPFRPTELAQGTEMCGKVDLAQIAVQFLYFAPGQHATPSQSKDISVQVDTIGPAPPTGLRTLPGNGRIKVVWDNISGEGGVSVLTGVKVYCDLVTGQTVPTEDDSNTSEECTEVPITTDDDSGADAGTMLVCEDAGTSEESTASACSSPNFSTNIIPDSEFNAQFECGSITGNAGSSVTATSLRGQPLQNRTETNPTVLYAVSVAATDAFNNVGPLSDPRCEYPELTTDFWENYRNAGGEAGGGCDASGSPVGSLSTLGVVGLAALSALRRRSPQKGSQRGAR